MPKKKRTRTPASEAYSCCYYKASACKSLAAMWMKLQSEVLKNIWKRSKAIRWHPRHFALLAAKFSAKLTQTKNRGHLSHIFTPFFVVSKNTRHDSYMSSIANTILLHCHTYSSVLDLFASSSPYDEGSWFRLLFFWLPFLTATYSANGSFWCWWLLYVRVLRWHGRLLRDVRDAVFRQRSQHIEKGCRGICVSMSFF